MTIQALKEALAAYEESAAVKIDGNSITRIDFVPAEGGYPAYIDMTGL